MLAVYLPLWNIAQRQLLILAFLCFWKIQLLEMEVFLTDNHRNAKRCRRRSQPYWVLPRPAESWFEIHFNQRIIPENFFYRQMRLKRIHLISAWEFCAHFFNGQNEQKVSVHARCLGALFLKNCIRLNSWLMDFRALVDFAFTK